MKDNKSYSEPKNIGTLLKLVANDEKKQQTVYVNLYEGVYDGDNEGGVRLKVTTERERARSRYLNDAHDIERYFLNTFQEHAIINRDDETMFCECYAETEEYCRCHAVVYVKSFDL